MFGEREDQLFVSILATLVSGKQEMVIHLLEPVGVPRAVYDSLMYRRDTKTGRTLGQGQLAIEICSNMQAMLPRRRVRELMMALIVIAGDWNRFELAINPDSALMTAVASRRYLKDVKTPAARLIREGPRAAERKRPLMKMAIPIASIQPGENPLLQMFDAMFLPGMPRMHGNWLRTLLRKVAEDSGVVITKAFTANPGFGSDEACVTSEFDLGGDPVGFLAKWTRAPLDGGAIEEILYFANTSGYRDKSCLLLSLSGWEPELQERLNTHGNTTFLFLDGDGLRKALECRQKLTDLIIEKMQLATLQKHCVTT